MQLQNLTVPVVEFPQGVTMYRNRILMLDVQSYYYGTGRCM